MSALRWTVFLAIPLVLVRVGLGCSDDGGEGPSQPMAPDGSTETDGAPAPPPIDPPAGEDAALHAPSFCTGIVLYANLDTTFAAQVGGIDASVYGGTKLEDAGRFGGSVALDPSTNGSWILYGEGAGGTFEFPEKEGSIALWARLPIDAPQKDGIYFRTVADVDAGTGTSQPIGLTLKHELTSRFGIVNEGTGEKDLLTFPWQAVKPHLRSDAFNHFAVAWRETDAGGPTAFLAINGGTGERYDDAGADASVYVDDAGNRAYRAVSTSVWGYRSAPTALRLGGSAPPTAPNADIDELAVWSRVLSFEEMDALHRSPVPVGVACKLTP